MTNGQVLALSEGLPLVDVPDMDGAFNYAVSANLLEANRVVESINKAVKPDEKMEEYEEKSRGLLKEYATKDDDGEAMSESFTVGGRTLVRYNIPGIGDPESKYSLAVEKLKKEYKVSIDAHDKKLEFLDKANKKFKLVTIHRSELPKGLSRAMMDVVLPLVDKK